MRILSIFLIRNLKQSTSISLFTPNNFLYHVAIYSQFLCNVGQLPARFFYFINKVRNGSRVMMQCLCYIKAYINTQYFLSRTEINFISLWNVTLFFYLTQIFL